MTFNAVKNEFENMFFILWIKIPRGFVRQDKFWSWQQGPANSYPLPFTMGKVWRMSLQHISYPHLFCQNYSPVPDIGIESQNIGYSVRVENVVLHIKIVQQTEILEYEANIGDAKYSPRSIV